MTPSIINKCYSLRMKIVLFLCAFILQIFCHADEMSLSDEEKPKVVAITTRPYVLNKELGVYYSYLPLDHFNHFQIYGMNYQNYFNDYLAWEIFNVGHSQAISTGLEERLKTEFGALPEQSDTLEAIYSTSLVYTPIYMKHVYRKNEIKYGDLSFVLGGGQGRFTKNGGVGFVQVGFSSRFIGQEGFNLKLDTRYIVFLNSAVQSNLSVVLVLSYNVIKKSETELVFKEE